MQAMMGHANIQTTMVYVHHVPQDDAADKLGRVVESASDPLGKLGSRELGPELGPRLSRCDSIARAEARQLGPT